MTGPQLYRIFDRSDFDSAARELDNHAAEAIALTKPEREPAVVVDIFSKERIR